MRDPLRRPGGRRHRALAPSALALGLLCWSGVSAAAQGRILDAGPHHLRTGDLPEWRESASHPHAPRLSIDFTVAPGPEERTLSLRQVDVKQGWRVVVNGHELGTLHRDENPIVGYWPVPGGVLRAGRNTLVVEPTDTLADDVWIDRVELVDLPLRGALSQASVEVEVVGADTGEGIPARITVTDVDGALHSLAAVGERTASRPGVVYTGSGTASIDLPAGSYRIYASRGFEYGADSARVVLRPGDRLTRRLSIRREVPTPGWVSSDTHIHTLTHSGHGDATAEDRVLTIAGEGIELPFITEHNRHVDLGGVAEAMGVRAHFTPVVGNEYTTPVGHFNVLPRSPGVPAPDPRVEDWAAVAAALDGAAETGVVTLNHGRDVHSGFRPFGPGHHVAVAGLNLDGWVLPANAMEVVNSGAHQTELMRPFADWFGMVNHGHALAPVGASDSHDVSRYLVGQARSYVRVADGDPGGIDVAEAVARLRAGAVMVSFGLLAELTVDGRYGPGDLAPAGDSVRVSVRVLGPGWTRADRVSLYANGERIRTASIADGSGAGVKWSGGWTLPRPPHDLFLVAIAEGPGDYLPFWPIAKPYQPASPEWMPRVIGASGAVWLDSDGDGRGTPARAYAAGVVAASGGDLPALVRALEPYDEAVAAQAAGLLLARGVTPDAPGVSAALRAGAPATRRGFRRFAEEWRAGPGSDPR